jgi:plasmid stabilization system protein ParE
MSVTGGQIFVWDLRVVARRHLVIYRVLQDEVRVQRIVHGARDLAALFAEED